MFILYSWHKGKPTLLPTPSLSGPVSVAIKCRGFYRSGQEWTSKCTVPNTRCEDSFGRTCHSSTLSGRCNVPPSAHTMLRGRVEGLGFDVLYPHWASICLQSGTFPSETRFLCKLVSLSSDAKPHQANCGQLALTRAAVHCLGRDAFTLGE